MNIYLISQNVNQDYDTYDSAVVVAADEDSARHIHPYGCIWSSSLECWVGVDIHGHTYSTVDTAWTTPDNVKVMLIGTENGNYDTGTVICASFNAG